MRYSKNENTYILAEFISGDTVTIDIYKLSDDDKVVDGANMLEISSTGIFKYVFISSLYIEVAEKTEFLLIASNGATSKNGQLVIGGYPDTLRTDITFIKEIEGGRWKIDTNTKQMIFYDEAGTAEIAKFQLYDKDHSPSDINVFERERI